MNTEPQTEIPNKNLTPWLTEQDTANFGSLVKGVMGNDLVMVATRRKDNLLPVALICVITRGKEGQVITPIAELIRGQATEQYFNPYDDFAQSAIN